MILTSLGRQAPPETKPLQGNSGCDAGPAAEDQGKERDPLAGFEAVVAALALASLTSPSAPTAAATADAGTDGTALPPGPSMGTPATLIAAAPEVQTAGGGALDAAILPDLPAPPLTSEISAESAVADTSARQGADAQTLARVPGQAAVLMELPAARPQQGADEAAASRAASDRPAAATPVRIIVHPGTGPSPGGPPGADGPAMGAAETADAPPTVEKPAETGARADAGSRDADAGSSGAGQSGHQKPGGTESTAPLSPAPQSPAVSDTDSGRDTRPTPDAAPPSRQEATASAVARAVHTIAEAVHHKGSGTVEIALSPEELGHVRLTIQSHDGGTASVHLSADRQDTLDLMRRHVELLAEDMRDLGYSELSFTFQDKAQRAPPDFAAGNRPDRPVDTPLPDPGHRALAGLPAVFSDSGLDLRI